MILFDSKKGLFKLDTKNSTYLFAIQEGHLYHLYYGKRFDKVSRQVDDMLSFKGTSFSALDLGTGWGRSSDLMPMEYPTYGAPDLRTPALHLRYSDGSSATDLRYVSYSVQKGKANPKGLPATYAEDGDDVETLSVYLKDSVKNITVILNYSVWYDYDAIARNTVVLNESEQDCSVLSACSAAFDITDAANYDMLNLYGVWGRERTPDRFKLRHGIQKIDSKRGSSSHNQNPFIALLSENCTEDSGEALGINLVYSGNFEGGVELDGYNTARVFMGINSFDFGYKLGSGERFETPEAVMVYSVNGIGKMSQNYHNLYRNRLCRGKYRDIERPILINNWEATYYDFDEEKIISLAKTAGKLGIELFVLDDGWFRERNEEIGSLGDWKVNRNKLPNGLSYLAEKINDCGLKFGLWMEPEMISQDSDLYRKHPDWCLHIDGRESCLGRNQLILDLSRDDVCDYLIDCISNLLDSANIEYIKWDMNRNMSEIGSSLLPAERQCETAYRYILGLYKILDALTSKYPYVLFEGCSGGGGRFDAGMLYYMPQIWTSDITDAEERLKLQYGTSIVYPFSAMGAHVSAVPNHQIGRTTPFKMRGNVSLMGQFGYELDIRKLNDEEISQIGNQISFYKKYGYVVHKGSCYRLSSPFESDLSVFEFVSEDKNTVLLFVTSIRALPNAPFQRIVMKGLENDCEYVEENSGIIATGGELCALGIPFVNESEHNSVIMVFHKK